MRRAVLLAAALPVLLLGCTAAPDSPAPIPPTESPTTPTATATPSARPTPTPSASTSTTRPPQPVRFDARRVQRDIAHLALAIGPREATSRNYAEAADWVERRLEGLGYRVRRTTDHGAGRELLGHPGTARHLGQRDRGATGVRPAVPARRGRRAPGHRAGGTRRGGQRLRAWRCCSSWPASRPPSRHRCRSSSSPSGRRSPAAPVTRCTTSDPGSWSPTCPRPSAGPSRAWCRWTGSAYAPAFVPVCRGGEDGTRLRAAVRSVGREAGITTQACENRTSDHWSYEKAGMPAVRIGSVPYAGYHSRRDVPSVVSRVQLDRVGRLIWAWLN